jgi:hypothetical protein
MLMLSRSVDREQQGYQCKHRALHNQPLLSLDQSQGIQDRPLAHVVLREEFAMGDES